MQFSLGCHAVAFHCTTECHAPSKHTSLKHTSGQTTEEPGLLSLTRQIYSLFFCLTALCKPRWRKVQLFLSLVGIELLPFWIPYSGITHTSWLLYFLFCLSVCFLSLNHLLRGLPWARERYLVDIKINKTRPLIFKIYHLSEKTNFENQPTKMWKVYFGRESTMSSSTREKAMARMVRANPRVPGLAIPGSDNEPLEQTWMHVETQICSRNSSLELKLSIPEDGPAKHFGKPGLRTSHCIKDPLSTKLMSSLKRSLSPPLFWRLEMPRVFLRMS